MLPYICTNTSAPRLRLHREPVPNVTSYGRLVGGRSCVLGPVQGSAQGRVIQPWGYDRPLAPTVGTTMYICYVDESGGFEAPNQASGATPLMTFAGLIIRTDALAPLTADFLNLKRRFYPGLQTVRNLDFVLNEVKGSGLRKRVRSQSREQRRHSIGVLDSTVRLIERYNLRLLGRVWIKEPDETLAPQASYTFAIQDIARHFNHFLESQFDSGLMLCDGRAHRQTLKFLTRSSPSSTSNQGMISRAWSKHPCLGVARTTSDCSLQTSSCPAWSSL